MNFLTGGLLGSLLSNLGKGHSFGSSLKQTGLDMITSNPFNPLRGFVQNRLQQDEDPFSNLGSFLYNYARRRRLQDPRIMY